MKKGETPAQDRIDKKMFEKLCQLGCTEEEQASYFKVDADTLNAWCKKIYKMTFSDTYKKVEPSGHISLRASQYKMAKTNPTMSIWLGKQVLGQTDKMEQTFTNEPELKIEVIDNSDLRGVMYGKKES